MKRGLYLLAVLYFLSGATLLRAQEIQRPAISPLQAR